MKYILSLAFIGIIGYSNAQSTVSDSFVYDGITRTYTYYIPTSYDGTAAVPLVLNLHGYTSDKDEQRLYTNFAPIADTANFIVVYPNGTINPNTNERFWNFGGLGSTVDDIGFLEALIDTMSANYMIDASRVYSCGMSNGGYMSYFLACHSNKFAAIASVTGDMTTTMYAGCSPNYPIPVMEIHGTNDAVVPYYGSLGNLPIEDVVQFWVTENQCNGTPTITSVPNTNTTDGATATHYVYSSGIDNHTVEFYKVTGGGHTWPGATVDIPTLGNTCRDFNASNEIWRFFSQYTRTLGLENVLKPTIEIYPNPTKGKISISGITPNSVVTLTSPLGQVLARYTVMQENFSINIAQFAPAIYILSVKTKNGEQFLRTIIKH